MESCWSPRSLSVLTLTLILTLDLNSILRVEACSPRAQVTHDAFYAGLDIICQARVQCKDPGGPAKMLKYCQSVGQTLTVPNYHNSSKTFLVNATTNATVTPNPQTCLDIILDPNQRMNDCNATNNNTNPNIAAIHQVIEYYGNWNKGFTGTESPYVFPTPKPYKTSWENYIQCLANNYNGTKLMRIPDREYVMGNTTNVFDFMTLCIANKTWFGNSMSIRMSDERVSD